MQLTIGVVRFMPGRWITVDAFSFKELALEVSGDEIPAEHLEVKLGGYGCGQPEESATEGTTPGLVEVDAGLLSTPLNTQSGFQGVPSRFRL